MRHYSHAIDHELEARTEREFDEEFARKVEEDPEGALMRGEWKRGIDRRSYGRQGGVQAKRATHDVKKLWGEHHTILDLAAVGMSNKAIAETMGCTPARVSSLKHSQLGSAKLRAMQALRDAGSVEVIRQVNAMVPRCLEVYAEILDSEETTYALKKATADTLVMKIAGHEAPKRLDVRSTSFKAEDLEELKRRGLEFGRQCGLVVDGAVVGENDGGEDGENG